MNLIEINEKLTGSIKFYGDSNLDEKSLENLKELGDLLIELTNKVVALKIDTDGRYEASGQALNKKANYILAEIREKLGDLNV